MEDSRLSFALRDRDDIRRCTTPEEVWCASKPESYMEVVIPFDVDPVTRQGIKDELKNHPGVYVRDGEPGEFAPMEQGAKIDIQKFLADAASYLRSIVGFSD